MNASADGDETRPTPGQAAARRRAAKEKLERLEEALRHCEELQEQREASAKKTGREAKEPRASTTDADARSMKFPDGGYQPGVNVQFATETESGVIAGVAVTNNGTDGNEFVPMLDQLNDRYQRMPRQGLVGRWLRNSGSDRAGRRTRVHRIHTG